MAEIYPPEYPSGTGAGRAREPERSVQEVVKDIVGNLQEIIRSEFQLARIEIREKSSQFGRAAVMLAAGGALVFYALGFLFVSIYQALDAVMPAGLAAVLMFLVLAVVSAVLVMSGIKRMKAISPAPERTIENARETVATMRDSANETAQTVKEEVQWSKNRIR
jgi:uncharacterized membrane protein YqjE